MTLGYLMAPTTDVHSVSNERNARTEHARTLGFSEFYQIPQDVSFELANQQNASLEHALSLCVLPKCKASPALKLVTIDGKRQPRQPAAKMAQAIPAQTVHQVISNAHENLPTLSVSWLNPTALAQHWAAHVTACTHKGRRVQPEHWRIARTIIVSDDPTKTSAAVFGSQSPCRAYYGKVARSAGLEVEALMKECVIHGTLAEVLADLQILKETCGPFGTLTLVDHAWPDHEMARLSMASLATALCPTQKRSWASR